MRRTLARTRDTLDVESLPSVEGTELNHRTKVWTDRQEFHFTVRMLFYLTGKVVFSVFVIRLMTVFGVTIAGFILLPFAVVMLALALSRYVHGWPLGPRLVKATSYVATFVVFVVLSLIGDIWAAYFAFGGAVILAAYLSRIIAKQYAFFMTVNDRVPRRTLWRWQGYWSTFPRLRGPRCLPEIAAHTWSFPLLLLPYAFGFGMLVLAERSSYGRFAGAIGVLGFLLTMPVVWFVLGDPRFTAPAPFFRSVLVCWKAVVTWVCYNRHQTPAAGVFRFPTRWTRLPALRDVTLYVGVGTFAMAILSAASALPGDVGRGIGTRLKDIPASIFTPRSGPVTLLPHEQAYLEQLPADERDAYQERVRERRIQEERQGRSKRWSVEGFTEDWIVGTIFALAFCSVAPLAAFFAVFWFVSGRILTAYYDALEAPGGYKQSTTTAPWDNRVERLLWSRDKVESEHLYVGRSFYGDYPVLLHQNLLFAHAHILGDTGSRKTSIGIAPMLSQLIGREDSAVLIIDLKGDKALFESAKYEAARMKIDFKWFTNITGRSSYVFNPFAQSHMGQLTISQKTQGVLQALSLEYGEGYGAGYYSAMHEIVLSTYMRNYRSIGSFKDLHKFLESKDAYRNIGDLNDWKEARHLTTLANKLAEVYPLNVKATDFPDRPKLFEKQIDLPSLLRERQVIYFYLASALESTTVSPVAKLAMFSLLTAAARRGAGEENRVYVFLDEFQRIISENVKIFLEQARSMKLHFILANQTAGQLESSGTDLTDTVDSCTAFKQSFKATDLKSLKKLEESSGEALYHSADWTEAIDAGLREAADEAFDVSHLPVGIFDESTVKVKETVGPRLERNTIIELSAKPMASFVRFTEGSGYTQFSGYYTPILSEFHISEKTFEARANLPWPKESPETVTGFPDAAVTGDRKQSEKGALTPENVPADFQQHLDERLTGPEVPRPERPQKPPKNRKGPK